MWYIGAGQRTYWEKTEKSGYKFRRCWLCDICVSVRLLRLETEEECKAKAKTL